MSSSLQILEQNLAERHGRRHCILTGRASSALHIAYRALGEERGKVVLPATLCPQPASVALNAGFEPVFCDVAANDANMDPEALERLLEETEDVVAIVVAHLYGEAADMQRIEAIARRYDVVLIEDVAQALGATLAGKPLGAFGDMSVLSFGHTKVIDAGHGGAVLTDSSELAGRLERAASELPQMPARFAERAVEYRRVYYTLKALADESEDLNRLFLPLPSIYGDLYVFGFDSSRADELLRRLDGLEDAVAARRRKADIYSGLLADSAVTLMHRTEGGVPWRFNVLLAPEQQARITEELRAAGFDASNWYPALPKWYAAGRRQDQNRLANARQVESRVLNLWLDDATDDHRVEACARTLVDLLGSCSPTPKARASRAAVLQ